MDPERWQRVEALYHAALARPAEERTAFLAAAGADEPIRSDVQSLLAQPDSGLTAFEAGALAMVAKAFVSGPMGGLAIGQRIGPYQVTARLGAGGMGEVYRAHDAKLGRDVAIKVLPQRFANDADWLSRFEREARMLASLNHPHIGAIYGVEESDSAPALILELIEGPTLADQLVSRPLSLTESLTIAAQIVDALDAAHQRGIVHRDLKPANIKITPDDIVKVLDFGLAKAMAGDVARDGTREGVILGTPSYMSPEQARGLAVDKRTDIWAFGCVLYEMLTGRPLFPGKTVSDTIAAILEREPDWTALPAASPALIRRLLRRCLEKDRTRRLADIADVRLEIADAMSGAHTDVPVAAFTSRSLERLTWLSALVLVGLSAAALAAWATRTGSAPPETTRTLLSVAPTGQSLGTNPLEQQVGGARPTRTAVALSPDGKTLVFGAIWGGDLQLYKRAMDQLNATPIAGASGGASPFFSPDGQWVGFWSGGELKKVPLGGGPPVTLCKAASMFGASWGSDGTIVFATARNGGLWRVSAAGGIPEALTTLQPGEYSHRLPHMLPGGQAVIFTIAKTPARWDDAQVVVRSLVTGKQTVLIEGGADGRYVSTGHLVYVHLGALMAAPFDPVRLALTGGATGLIDGVMQAANSTVFNFMADTGAAQFTLSDTGSLVYVTGGVLPEAQRSLAWVDRQGASQALPAPLRAYFAPRFSNDGQHVAVFIQQGGARQVWSYDIARGALSAVTVDGRSSYGIYAPDRKRMVFRSSAAGAEDNLYWTAADGSGAVERLTTSARSQTPASWSPDGTTFAFVEEGDRAGQFDIWVMSIADRKTRAVVQTEADETSAEFSPDGRWLAYVSNQSGRYEVYVQPYPGPGERHLISTNGGQQPAWGGNRELFYVQPGATGSQTMTLMSVAVVTGRTFSAGTPEALFESVNLQSAWGRSYDVAPDGRRFLITRETEQPVAPSQMIFVEHWLEELKRIVPTH